MKVRRSKISAQCVIIGLIKTRENARCEKSFWERRLFLPHWNFRIQDWRDHVIHVVLVARRTVLPRGVCLMTALTDFLFHCAETRREFLRVALFVALQIRAVFFEAVACQTATRSDGREMWFMDEFREATAFVLE